MLFEARELWGLGRGVVSMGHGGIPLGWPLRTEGASAIDHLRWRRRWMRFDILKALQHLVHVFVFSLSFYKVLLFHCIICPALVQFEEE
jgi:hypothetical protein